MEFSDNAGHPADQTDSVDLQHALVTGVVGPGRPGAAGAVVSPHVQPPLKATLAEDLQEGCVVTTAVVIVHSSVLGPQCNRLNLLSICRFLISMFAWWTEWTDPPEVRNW